jgi:hypothetical protein
MAVSMDDKAGATLRHLRNLERVIVAFSGGTDSAYLAWAANHVLGKNALAVTADSASIPESHKRDAEAFVARFGIAHEYIQTREFDNPDYARNDPDRCFHCKDELFTRLEELGRERGYRHIVYGVNLDDLGDYRPGQGAARNHQVAAPLADAGLSKAEIRELSRRGRVAHVGPAGLGVPEFAHPLWNAGDDSEREDGGDRRRGNQGARIPPVPRALPRRGGPHRDRARRNGAGAVARDGGALHADFQEAGIPLRHVGSGRLPAGIAQRSPESDDGGRDAGGAGLIQRFDRIATDPEVMGGKPCIRGMRVTAGLT